MIDLNAVLLHVILNVIIITPLLWLAGRMLTGGAKAKFTDALIIVVLGTVIGSIVNFLFSTMAAGLILIVVWLALIKHFFDCGWLRAFLIALLAAVIYIVVTVMLAIIALPFRILLRFL